MKNAPLLVVTIITTAILLSVAGACDGGDGVPVTTPQVAEVQEVVAVDTMRPANPTPPSQKRTAATNTPIPTLTPARTATPVSQSRPGLGVTKHAVQTGLEEKGFSFVSYASVGTVYGDSADGTTTVKLFAPDDALREATMQFYYTPALKPESVVLRSLFFTNLVLPDWNNSGDWLANAFRRAANGESVETSFSTASGKAYIVLEIIGGNTVSLGITSSDSNNYALEILGVSPTPTSTRTSGVTRLVPILPDILKETFTPVVIFTPSPTPVGGSVFDPCGITKISSDMSQEEIKKRINCARTPTSLTPAPTEYITHTDIDALEERAHELINSARAEQGLTGVDLDEQARAIARAHSADMANGSFITNAVLVGSYEYCATWVHQSWIYDSYEAQGSVHIPRNWRTPEELALAVVDGWMNSTEGHREAILDPAFRKAGVGIAISDDGQIFFTQIFCETD